MRSSPPLDHALPAALSLGRRLAELRGLALYHIMRIWERRWLVLATACPICMLGWFVVLMLPNHWTSTTRLYVNADSLLKPLMRDLTVQTSNTSAFESVRRMLLSPPILAAIEQKVGLPAGTLQKRAGQGIVLKEEMPNLFSLSYEDKDRYLAKAVVEALTAEVIKEHQNVATENVTNARRFIDSQIAEYDGRLRETEQRIAEFQRDHAADLIAVADRQHEAAGIETELNSYDAQLSSQIYQRDQISTEVAKTPQYLGDRDLARRPNGTLLSPEQAHLLELRKTLADLRRLYTDQHPDVIATQREIAAAEAAAQGSGSGAAPGAPRNLPLNPDYVRLREELRKDEAQIFMLKQQIDNRRKRLDEIHRDSANVPEAQLQLAQLNRDYEILKTNYNTLVQRREAANFTQNLDDNASPAEFRIIEPPSLPLLPSWPWRTILSFAVACVAVFAGLAHAFLRYQFSGAPATVGELAAIIPCPTLGSVTRTYPQSYQPSRIDLPLFFAGVVALGGILVALAFYYRVPRTPPDLHLQAWVGAAMTLLNRVF